MNLSFCLLINMSKKIPNFIDKYLKYYIIKVTDILSV